MLLSLSEKQCNTLRYIIQQSYSAFAEHLNAMDNGDMPYNDALYIDYYNKYHELQEIDDYILMTMNECR